LKAILKEELLWTRKNS